MTVLGEKIPWHFQGSKISPDGQKMPWQSQISQQYQSPEQPAFATDTNLHKPLILQPTLHAPQINKTMSNLLQNSPWKIAFTFPNDFFCIQLWENVCQCFFISFANTLASAALQTSSHKTLVFAQCLYVLVENHQVKIPLSEANQLKSIL